MISNANKTFQLKCVVRLNGETHIHFGNVYSKRELAVAEEVIHRRDFESFGCEVKSEIIEGDRSKEFVVTPLEVNALLMAETN